MIIKIPFKTPSVNHLYFNFRNIRVLTKEARILKKEIAEIVEDMHAPTELPKNKPLKVVVSIHEDWFCKNGSIKRADIANREKFLIDSIFDALGIDDKNIFINTFIKVQDESSEFAEIEISLL